MRNKTGGCWAAIAMALASWAIVAVLGYGFYALIELLVKALA